MPTSRLYVKAAINFGEGDIDFLVDDIKMVLVDLADYTPNFSTDEFLSDIPAAARVATSGNLSGKTITEAIAGAAVFDCNDEEIVGVAGDQFEAIVLYKDTGAPGTSPVIMYDDTGTGLPFTPSGGNIIVRPKAPASGGLFRIGTV